MKKRILITGGGSSGWMTAAYLSKFLPEFEISLVEASDIPTVGVGESTVPPLVHFMDQLGLKEREWMPKCNATYKSSICFQDFYKQGEPPFWFPFSGTETLEGVPLNRFWYHNYLNNSEFSSRHSFYDYCYFAPAVCRAGSTVKALPFPTGYAYHIDSGLFGEVLKEFATSNGVNHVIDEITEANLNSDGTIHSLYRKNGEPLEADLFIDCSGFGSFLMDKVMQEPFDEYYDSLFNNKAVAIRTEYVDKPTEMSSYTLCTAVKSGWIWRVPLNNRIGNGYVYCDAYCTPDQAETELRQHLGEERTKGIEAKHLDLRVGKHRRSWVKNCVAVGLSGGFVEPLESTGLQIVQGQVELLAHILKNQNGYSIADVATYNTSVTRLYEVIRDFLVCHYALTSREDTNYWKDVKYNTVIPDSLSRKLAVARVHMPDQGYLSKFDDGGLAGFNFNDGWLCVLIGMNFMPFEHESIKRSKVGPYDDRVTKNLSKAAQRLKGFEKMKRENFSKLPNHFDWLKDNIFG